MKPEQAIQRQILDLLRWRHILCWKNNTAGIYVRKRDTYIPSGAPGVSDILGVLRDRRCLAIEVKAPKGRVSPHQQVFIDEINNRGGLAFVAHSVEEVQEKLNGYFGSNNQRSAGRLAESDVPREMWAMVVAAALSSLNTRMPQNSRQVKQVAAVAKVANRKRMP